MEEFYHLSSDGRGESSYFLRALLLRQIARPRGVSADEEGPQAPPSERYLFKGDGDGREEREGGWWREGGERRGGGKRREGEKGVAGREGRREKGMAGREGCEKGDGKGKEGREGDEGRGKMRRG